MVPDRNVFAAFNLIAGRRYSRVRISSVASRVRMQQGEEGEDSDNKLAALNLTARRRERGFGQQVGCPQPDSREKRERIWTTTWLPSI
jgi:hypothetical protein